MLRTSATMNMSQREKTFGKSGQAIIGNTMKDTFHHGISTSMPAKLGSIHTGHLNYARDHTFYHNGGVQGKSVIAPEVRKAVTAMKDLTNPDLLARKKPYWNTSVLPPEKPQNHLTVKSTENNRFEVNKN